MSLGKILRSDASRVPEGTGSSVMCGREKRACSLDLRRLPQLDLVSFWINDPAKLPILGFIDLLEHIAAFFLQGLDQGVEVFHSVVDHEGSRARSKLLTFLRTDEPGS